MNFKYLVIISGCTVGSIYTMGNEQSKNKRPQLIPVTSFSTMVPYYKSNKQKSKNLTLKTLLTSEKYNKIAIYIETKPFSKTKPRLEYGVTAYEEEEPELKAALVEAMQKKQCFYYPEDHITFRDMREERWHVPYILITDDANPSALIHG